MPQITARLSPDIRDRFYRYAAEVGLHASELARLLDYPGDACSSGLLDLAKGRSDLPRKSSKKYGERKLTAHFHLPEKVAEFDRYAHAHGLARAAAARLLIERELRAKWLMKAFAWSPETPL